MRKNTLPLALFALSILGLSSNAHAYLDAGTGSMLVQILLGGVAGLAVAGKLFWHRILEIFRRSPSDKASTKSPD